MSRLADFLIGGWELQGIQAVNTGTPRTIRGRSLCNCSGENRPDRVAGVSVYPADQSATNWFNPAAFTDPAFGTIGNSGRNIISTATQVNVETSLFKDFRIKENAKLQFRSEFFNMLNAVNLGPPNTQLSAGDRMGRITTADDARVIQFALKLLF